MNARKKIQTQGIKKLLLLSVLGFLVQSSAFAQLANNQADAEFICASELGVSISNILYDADASDPTPSCLGGAAVTQSAWFKVKAQAAGTIEINLKNIEVGKQFVVAAYPEGSINDVSQINCAVLDADTLTMTFDSGAADEVYYILVEGVSGAEGSFSISATGSAIASPDLVLTPNRVIGCFGSDVIFTNNSTLKGDKDEFELVVKFDNSKASIPCGVNTDTWAKPQVVSVSSGTTANHELDLGSEFTLPDDFPKDATITLRSDYPGTWELTIRPKNHECFDARYSQMTMTSDVLRLLAFVKDPNGDEMEDDGSGCPAPFCEQTPPSAWAAEAKLLPEETGFKGNITDWEWIFTDKDGDEFYKISNGDAGFTTASSNTIVSFTHDIDTVNSMFDVSEFDVQVKVTGDCGPFDEKFHYVSYEPIIPEVITNNGTDSIVVCLSDISPSDSLAFSIKNLGDFSTHPEEIAPPITWEIHADMGLDTTMTGSSNEVLSFINGETIVPGKYTVTARMADQGGCEEVGSAIVVAVLKEDLAIDSIVTEQPRPSGCNEDAFYPDEKVDFYFTVKDITPSQKSKVTVTYDGNPVEFSMLYPAAANGNEFIVDVDSATFVASIIFTGSSSSIEINVVNEEYPGICNTQYSETLEPAYTFEDPDLTASIDTVCIGDISSGNPWFLTVKNADSFSPEATKDTVVWDLGGLVSTASNYTGSLKDSVIFTNGNNLEYGEYTITATLIDAKGCESIQSMKVRLVQKETITITNTERDSELPGCSQNAYYPGEKVDYYFTIDKVTATEGSKITVTFDGNPVTFEQLTPVTGSGTEFNLTDSASFKATVVMPADFTSIPFVIQASNNTFTDVCKPAVNLNLKRAYETDPAVLVFSRDTACIQTISNGNPILLTTSNANTFSPQSLDTVHWDMSTIDPSAYTIIGDAGDTLKINNRTLLEAGIYDIGVTLIDANGCEGTGTSKLHLVSRETLTVTDTITTVERDDCGTRAYLEGDKITFNFEVADGTVGQSVQVTATYAGNMVYNVTQTDTLSDHSFEIIHNGNVSDEVMIEVMNITYPNICAVNTSIYLPIKGETSPELSVSADSICEKDITDDIPITILIGNATKLPGGAGAISTQWTWSGLAHAMDSSNILNDNIDPTRLQLIGLEADVYTVSANVNFGSGCSDIVSISFEVFPQADIALDTIELVSTESACPIPDQYQDGDVIDYKYQVTGIEEDLVVSINYPRDTTFNINVADGATYNGSLRFTVREGGELGSISVRSANTTRTSCAQAFPINIPFTSTPLEVSLPDSLESGALCTMQTSVALGVSIISTSGSPTIAWFVNDVKQASTNSVLILNNLEEGEEYNVVVNVKNATCEVFDSVLVKVSTDLPTLETKFVTTPDNESCTGESGFCKGEIVEFEYTPVGGTAPYQVHINIPSEDIDDIITLNDNTTQLVKFIVYDDAEIGLIKIWDGNSSENCAMEYPIEVPILKLASEINTISECTGSLSQVIGVVPECEGIEFDWSESPNSDLIVGETNQSMVTLNFEGQESGEYDFEVKLSGLGCSRIITQTVNFSRSLPDTIIASTGTTGFCMEDLPQNGLVLSAQKFNGDIPRNQVNYDWRNTTPANWAFVRAGTSFTESNIILDIPENTPAGDYEFLVEVEDNNPENECSTALTYVLRVIDTDQVEIVDVTSDENGACTYEDIILQASGGINGEYTWSQVDPTSGSVIQQFTETTSQLTIYSEAAGTFRYVAQDASGSDCVTEGTFDLVINQCDLFIPNAFTPGYNDGINQTFEIQGIAGKDWELIVINRYGEEVYRNDNYDNSWDGEDVTDGTYFYTLTSPQGEKVYKGWVKILRVNPKGDVNR